MKLYVAYHIYNAHKGQANRILYLGLDFFQQGFLSPFRSRDPNTYAIDMVRFLIFQQQQHLIFLLFLLTYTMSLS